jgi:hypothetical protein
VGNTNRLKHGRFTTARVSRRKEITALLRAGRNLIRRIEMMAWSRKALRRKLARDVAARALRGAAVMPRCELGEPRSMAAHRRATRARSESRRQPTRASPLLGRAPPHRILVPAVSRRRYVARIGVDERENDPAQTYPYERCQQPIRVGQHRESPGPQP